MKFTKSDAKQFVKENDIKFIRLAFCDVFGKLKNISIMASELERAFENGISFDASAIEGFLNTEEADLYLFPDASTFSILPWRPQQGRVVRFYCDIKKRDGSDFTDGRLLLKRAVEKAKLMGIDIKIGVDCEFYLFENDENGISTNKPQDNAGYLDVAPLDKGENVRREICLTLEQMGIIPISSHHEQGPGQNEIDFLYGDAFTCADNLITLKSVVSTIAGRNGLSANFSPKPIESESGNGLHINLYLFKDGLNIFKDRDFDKISEAEYFTAGVLNRCSEMTLFLNPEYDSYKRFGSLKAPKYISWSNKNLSQLIRILSDIENDSRMELRSPDPMCNPYIAFALIIYAGLEGIENKQRLCKATDINLLEADEIVVKNLQKLPDNLKQAIDIAKKSIFIKNIIPKKLFDKFIEVKLK